jgi:prophage regulatory protein
LLTHTQPQRLLRLKQVLELIPISRANWYAGVKAGRYPEPVHLGPRCVAWRESDIANVIGSLK